MNDTLWNDGMWSKAKTQSQHENRAEAILKIKNLKVHEMREVFFYKVTLSQLPPLQENYYPLQQRLQ